MKADFYYGDCQKCHGAIAIPGLEAYLCDRCRWVPRTKVRTPKVAKSTEPVTVISFTKPDDPKRNAVKPDAVKPDQTILELTL